MEKGGGRRRSIFAFFLLFTKSPPPARQLGWVDHLQSKGQAKLLRAGKVAAPGIMGLRISHNLDISWHKNGKTTRHHPTAAFNGTITTKVWASSLAPLFSLSPLPTTLLVSCPCLPLLAAHIAHHPSLHTLIRPCMAFFLRSFGLAFHSQTIRCAAPTPPPLAHAPTPAPAPTLTRPSSCPHSPPRQDTSLLPPLRACHAWRELACFPGVHLPLRRPPPKK